MGTIIKFEDNSSKFKQETNDKVGQILTAIGLKAVTIWQKEITSLKIVDTGRFRNSTTSEVNRSDKSVTIGSNVFYARYLELGTSRMKARPSLKNTIMNYRDSYKKIAEQIWKS